MGPLEREAAQQRGQRKLDAMKQRAGRLRRRVVATAIAGFVLLWTVVFVQMATGNDPVLVPSATTMRAAIQEEAASDPERRSPRAAAGVEAERARAEQAEAEQLEAEEVELEELEAVTTGQS